MEAVHRCFRPAGTSLGNAAGQLGPGILHKKNPNQNNFSSTSLSFHCFSILYFPPSHHDYFYMSSPYVQLLIISSSCSLSSSPHSFSPFISPHINCPCPSSPTGTAKNWSGCGVVGRGVGRSVAKISRKPGPAWLLFSRSVLATGRNSVLIFWRDRLFSATP